MGRRVGIIQTRGIGDIIIALPIAQAFLAQGEAVFWPVDEKYAAAFQAAEPAITFVSFEASSADGQELPNALYETPSKLLKELNCEAIYPLYNYLKGSPGVSSELARFLKFDEYKYAVAGVPFSKKWDLRIQRNPERERALYDRFKIQDGEKFICLHSAGSNGWSAKIELPQDWLAGRRVIHVEPLTDSIFDWLLVLEKADYLFLLESCFSNLVEQLNFTNAKSVMLRAPGLLTPVLKNGWHVALPQTPPG